MKSVDDAVFGRMDYNHRWVKKEKISMWGSSHLVTIAAKAYRERPITDEERKSYEWFKNHLQEISDRSAEIIVGYAARNLETWRSIAEDARAVRSERDFSGVILLTEILFQQDGTVLLLCEVPWDKENGIAVQVYPEYKAGSQDFFL